MGGGNRCIEKIMDHPSLIRTLTSRDRHLPSLIDQLWFRLGQGTSGDNAIIVEMPEMSKENIETVVDEGDAEFHHQLLDHRTELEGSRTFLTIY